MNTWGVRACLLVLGFVLGCSADARSERACDAGVCDDTARSDGGRRPGDGTDTGTDGLNAHGSEGGTADSGTAVDGSSAANDAGGATGDTGDDGGDGGVSTDAGDAAPDAGDADAAPPDAGCSAGLVLEGDDCVEDDACAAAPCGPGRTCTDVPAPGTGHDCGPCPPGYTAQGDDCERDSAWAALALGWNHGCGLDEGAGLWCWGETTTGVFGDGNSSATSPLPEQAGGARVWQRLAAHGSHACGIDGDDGLWCWGLNGWGQLGVELPMFETVSAVPVQVDDASTWLDVDVGLEHTCAIRSDTSLWCWGRNGYGQLGDGTLEDRPAPTRVGDQTGWSAVATGPSFSCAIRAGTLWCWGAGGSGSLGNAGNAMLPLQVGTDSDWAAVAASAAAVELAAGHACALKTGGTLWCWGLNAGGQLGVGSNTGQTCQLDSCSSAPLQVAGADWERVALGAYHTCATRTDGTLWCWGYDEEGELGHGIPMQQWVPRQLGAATDWAHVDAGPLFTCAVRDDGTRWCWGLNDAHQLGDGTSTGQPEPILVP